jgi:hypothetical protein
MGQFHCEVHGEHARDGDVVGAVATVEEVRGDMEFAADGSEDGFDRVFAQVFGVFFFELFATAVESEFGFEFVDLMAQAGDFGVRIARWTLAVGRSATDTTIIR